MDPAGPYKRPCPYSLVNTGNNSVRKQQRNVEWWIFSNNPNLGFCFILFVLDQRVSSFLQMAVIMVLAIFFVSWKELHCSFRGTPHEYYRLGTCHMIVVLSLIETESEKRYTAHQPPRLSLSRHSHSNHITKICVYIRAYACNFAWRASTLVHVCATRNSGCPVSRY